MNFLETFITAKKTYLVNRRPAKRLLNRSTINISLLLVFLKLLAVNQCLSQEITDIPVAGKWTGVLSMGYSQSKFDFELELSNEDEKMQVYTGTANGKNRDKGDRTHAKSIKLVSRLYFENGKLIFSANNKSFLNSLNGGARCEMRAVLSLFKKGDKTIEISGNYLSPNCATAQGGSIWLTRVLTDQEYFLMSELARKRDSVYLAKYGDKSIRYINLSCDEASRFLSRYPGKKDCSYYYFYTQYGDTSIQFKQPFGYGQYYSENVSLVSENKEYDGRLLGIWRTEDYYFVYKFNLTQDNKYPIRVITYYLDEKTNTYNDVSYAFSKLYATAIDSVNFLENIGIGSRKKEIIDIRFLSNYRFSDNNTMIFSQVSAEYNNLNQQFQTTDEYRQYVKNHMNTPAFYMPAFKLIRLDFRTRLPESVIEKKDRETKLFLSIFSKVTGAVTNYINGSPGQPAYESICGECGGVGEVHDRIKDIYNMCFTCGGSGKLFK